MQITLPVHNFHALAQLDRFCWRKTKVIAQSPRHPRDCRSCSNSRDFHFLYDNNCKLGNTAREIYRPFSVEDTTLALKFYIYCGSLGPELYKQPVGWLCNSKLSLWSPALNDISIGNTFNGVSVTDADDVIAGSMPAIPISFFSFKLKQSYFFKHILNREDKLNTNLLIISRNCEFEG